ncbi:MAG: hypothetical protein KF700_04275 [Hyphomonadaceae bacterium]|nr:hypothetical protein [Hyphomonadaceae bacterium]
MNRVLAALAFSLFAGAALAHPVHDPLPGPEPARAPSYGEATLPGGSGPYPYIVQIRPGGDVQATQLGPPCAGWIAAAPDFRVRYRGGGSDQNLHFAVRDAHTTLIINDARGAWRCATGEILFTAPSSGQYDVWLGATEHGVAAAAVALEISEQPARAD